MKAAGKEGEDGCLGIYERTRRLVTKLLTEEGSKNALNSEVGAILWTLETIYHRVKKQKVIKGKWQQKDLQACQSFFLLSKH